MFSSVLLVCVGNICRSPIAEYLLIEKLKSKNVDSVLIGSAGVGAVVGHQADKTSQLLLQEQGIDASQHRARQLTADLIANYELILVMEKAHIAACAAISTAAQGRTFLIRKWLDDADIIDPHRKSESVFREIYPQIEQGVDSWIAKLWPNRS